MSESKYDKGAKKAELRNKYKESLELWRKTKKSRPEAEKQKKGAKRRRNVKKV